MKIKVIKYIRPEIPIPDYIYKTIKPGIYEAEFNKHGAVSVTSTDGEKVGVKLDGFEFLSCEDQSEWIKMIMPNLPGVTKEK